MSVNVVVGGSVGNEGLTVVKKFPGKEDSSGDGVDDSATLVSAVDETPNVSINVGKLKSADVKNDTDGEDDPVVNISVGALPMKNPLSEGKTVDAECSKASVSAEKNDPVININVGKLPMKIAPKEEMNSEANAKRPNAGSSAEGEEPIVNINVGQLKKVNISENATNNVPQLQDDDPVVNINVGKLKMNTTTTVNKGEPQPNSKCPNASAAEDPMVNINVGALQKKTGGTTTMEWFHTPSTRKNKPPVHHCESFKSESMTLVKNVKNEGEMKAIRAVSLMMKQSGGSPLYMSRCDQMLKPCGYMVLPTDVKFGKVEETLCVSC